MVYTATWLSDDTKLLTLRTQHNEAVAARYYENLAPIRSTISRLASLFRRIGQLWHAWSQSRAQSRIAIAELSGLDDRLLKDIGVTRSQIPALAQHAGQHAGKIAYSQIVNPPSATPARHKAIAKAALRSGGQVISLARRAPKGDEPKGDIVLNATDKTRHAAVPLNAA